MLWSLKVSASLIPKVAIGHDSKPGKKKKERKKRNI
jgi:hypothetical protein